MLAKLGLILLLLFGFALAFVAGVMAPADLRGDISAAADKTLAVPLVADTLAAVGVETRQEAVAEAPEAVPFKSLLVPPVVPEGALLALRADTFDFPEPAQQAAARLQTLEYTTRVIPIIDRFDGRSWVVAVGEYDTEKKALEARDALARRAGLQEEPRVILLPPEKKKK